ncbi:MAG: chromosomal replication initiator protein DnaA [Oscillospiraceae bacterium]|nr:chromosomal replication initiator protein DnaA [Oscillospiraceae bacterium]
MNSATDVWNRVQSILSTDLTQIAMDTWFKDCRAVEVSDGRLYLHAPTSYKKETIESRFAGSIKSALCEIFSGEFDVVILDDEGLACLAEAEKDPELSSIDDFTFERFVVGNTNKFAHAAARVVAEGQQKKDFNPLFIYGESGLGKTHLLHAIRHYVERNFPRFHIIYVTCEDFTNELIGAIRFDRNVEFREKYRNADLLLIDDIQFIARSISTQEEVFNTFNTLFSLGKQIVFTSDRPPQEIHTLEDRLKTRFESGIMADIQPPDDALRIAIIRNKAEQLGVSLPDDVTNYIADNLSSNIRQLEGAVKMIIAYRDIMQDDITVESVKTRLKDFFKGPRDLMLTIDDIVEETARFYSLTPDDIKGQSRARDTTLARQVSMYLIRKLTNFSLKEIGLVFEGRDHSTVLSSINRIEKRIQESEDLSSKIKDIMANIQAKSKDMAAK